MTQNQLQTSDYYIHQTLSNNYDDLSNHLVPLYVVTSPSHPNYYNISNQNYVPNYINQTSPNNYENNTINNNLVNNVLVNDDLVNNDITETPKRTNPTCMIMFAFCSIVGICTLLLLLFFDTSKKQ